MCVQSRMRSPAAQMSFTPFDAMPRGRGFAWLLRFWHPGSLSPTISSCAGLLTVLQRRSVQQIHHLFDSPSEVQLASVFVQRFAYCMMLHIPAVTSNHAASMVVSASAVAVGSLACR